MTHHGNESEHAHESQHADGTRDENEPVGGTLGTTGTEGYGMPEQVVGDSLHTDERAQTAEESVNGAGPGADLGGNSAGIPRDQVTSVGGVSSDPLDGQNATGGYGDESTGLSDQATSDEAPTPAVDGDAGGDFPADADLIDRDPGEDATTVNGGNADR